jgi:WD40 repeat protein
MRQTDDDDDITVVQALIAAAFSGDRQTLASGSIDRTINLWDIEAGAESRTLKGHSGWDMSVAFSGDGQMLTSGSDDHTIKLWDTKTGVELHTLQAHSDSVWSVAFSGDGQTLASGAELKPMANTLYAEGHTSNQSYSIPQLHDSTSSNISPQVSVPNN